MADLSQLSEAILKQVTHSDGRPNQVIRLLLRSSGEPRAEQMRLGLLRNFSEHLATTAGWNPDDTNSDGLLLRAQLVLALSIGVTVLSVSPGLDPLATATERDLAAPIRDVVDALLSKRSAAITP